MLFHQVEGRPQVVVEVGLHLSIKFYFKDFLLKLKRLKYIFLIIHIIMFTTLLFIIGYVMGDEIS